MFAMSFKSLHILPLVQFPHRILQPSRYQTFIISIRRVASALDSIMQTRDQSAHDAAEENVFNDFDQIKATVEPLRQIFDALLENTELRYINRIVANDSYLQSTCNGVAVYTLYHDDLDGSEAQ